MFINCSNHKFSMWDDAQKNAALKWGEVEDIPFPNVNPYLSSEEIKRLAADTAELICSYNPAVVMCQGEFTLTFELVKILKEKGIRVVSACSERNVIEKTDGGACKKEVFFRFVRFREY